MVNHVFNSAFTALSGLPGGLLNDLVGGVLVLLRRSLFLVPEGVSASQVGDSLSVAVNTGSVAYLRRDGDVVQVSGDPWFFGAKSFVDSPALTVSVGNPGSAGCAGVVLASGTVSGALETVGIDSLRFGAGAAFGSTVSATLDGGVLSVRDAVRGLEGVEFNAPVVLASDVEVDAGGGDAVFNGAVDGARSGRQSLTVTASGTTTFAAAVGGAAPLAGLLTRAIAPLSITESADTKTIPLHYMPEYSATGQPQVKYGIDVALGDNPSQVYEFDTGGVSFFAGYNPAFWTDVPLTSIPISETYSSGNYYNGVIADTRITLGSGTRTVSTGRPIQIAAILDGGNNTGTFDFTNPDAPPVETRFFGDFGASFATLPVPGQTTALANPLFQLPGNLSSGFLVQLGPIGIAPQLTMGITDDLRAQFPYAVPVTPQPGGGTYPVSGYDVLSWFGFAPSYTATLGGDEQQIGVTPTLPSLIDSGAPSTSIRLKGQGGDPFNVGGQLQPGATFTGVFPTTQGRPPLTWSFPAGNIGSVNLVNYVPGEVINPGQNVNTGLDLYNAFDVMFDVAEGVIWLRPTGGQATVTVGSVTTTGAQNYRQNAQLSGTYTTGDGGFSVAGVTTLLGSVVVNAGSGDVTFSGTVDSISGAQTLTVNSGGATGFARQVGSQVALGALTTDAPGTTNTSSVQTTGSQSYADAVTLNGLYTVGGGSFTVGGPALLDGPVDIEGGDITFSGPIDSVPGRGYSLTLNPGNGKHVLLAGATGVSNPLGGLTVQVKAGHTGTVEAPGYVALSGDLGFSGKTGLYIGNGVTASFTGGGVIRGFTDSGVVIEASTDSVIDGFAITTNGVDGIQLNGATAPTITNNVILGNGTNGIYATGTDDARITSNTVLNNADDGVVIDTGTGNQILSNSIFGNGGSDGLGIRLTNGGNNNQPAPIITGVTPTPTGLTVATTVTARPDYSGTFTVQVFYSAAGAGNVQGQQLVYEQTGVAAGPAQFSVTAPAPVPGGVLTVTATPDAGPRDTSPFSVGAVDPPVPV